MKLDDNSEFFIRTSNFELLLVPFVVLFISIETPALAPRVSIRSRRFRWPREFRNGREAECARRTGDPTRSCARAAPSMPVRTLPHRRAHRGESHDERRQR